MKVDKALFILIFQIIGVAIMWITAFILYYNKRNSGKEAVKQKKKADSLEQQLLASLKELNELRARNIDTTSLSSSKS